MSTPRKPWTFEPFDIYEDRTWAILDPNLATQVAIFFDQDEAEAYLAWRNRRQAKKAAKKAKRQEAVTAKDRAAAEAQIASWAAQEWS